MNSLIAPQQEVEFRPLREDIGKGSPHSLMGLAGGDERSAMDILNNYQKV